MFLLLVPALVAAAPPKFAGAPAIDAVTACRSIAADSARLACYDKAAGALDTAVSQHDITVLDRQEVRKTRRSLFGFQLPNLALFGVGEKDDAKAPEFTELDSTITSVRSVSYGKWDMTIADGDAVWRNSDLIDARPEVGAKVHIKAGLIGSYFFKIGSDRPVKANRVR